MKILPELLNDKNGDQITTVEAWEARRKEILEMLAKNEYGVTPPVYGRATGTVKEVDEKCASGQGVLEDIDITFPTEKGNFTFPIHYFHPNDGKKHFTFVLLNFRPDAYDMYFPAEEIIDNGFGVAVIYYQHISSDDADLTDKLGGMFTRANDGTDWGKIGMWAYAASRVADYLLTRDEVSDLGVIGHSRLGKTALWCAAQDERFVAAFSNCSGCSGASYERGKHPKGETIKLITNQFPYWFCEKYREYADHSELRPFDQHFLLSLIAPRLLCVGSGSEDYWADPYTEQMSCIGASPAWEIYGKDGFVGKEEQAKPNEVFGDGNLQYDLREGIHFLGRKDWNFYMNFLKEKGL